MNTLKKAALYTLWGVLHVPTIIGVGLVNGGSWAMRWCEGKLKALP